MSIQQIVNQQNQRLVDNNSIYRFKLLESGLVDLVDINDQPTCHDEEARYVVVDQIVDFTTNLIEAEHSYL